MHPYIRLGDTVIEGYALFFLLGWLAGGAVFYAEVRRRGWPLDKLLFAMTGCVFGAAAGAITAGVLFFDWPELASRASTLDLVGKSFVGGVLGGFAGVEVAKKLVGYPHSTGDAFALAIPIGHAIGRMGCLMGGCCYGTVTTLPWAVRYPKGSQAFLAQLADGQVSAVDTASLPVHPAPLYELGFDLVMFAVLYLGRDRLRVRGNLFRCYLFGYAIFRFTLEFFRADSPFPAVGGPKPIQFLLVLMAVRYAWVLSRQELSTRRAVPP